MVTNKEYSVEIVFQMMAYFSLIKPHILSVVLCKNDIERRKAEKLFLEEHDSFPTFMIDKERIFKNHRITFKNGSSIRFHINPRDLKGLTVDSLYCYNGYLLDSDPLKDLIASTGFPRLLN